MVRCTGCKQPGSLWMASPGLCPLDFLSSVVFSTEEDGLWIFNPSTVRISLPAIKQIGTKQLLMARYVGLPCESRSTMATEQAPQSPSAQPSFEPVKPCF